MPFGLVVSRRIWERGFGERKATATVLYNVTFTLILRPDTPNDHKEKGIRSLFVAVSVL